jgi:DNA invertase Pin-like site-specific DNA recombinase
MSQQNAKVYSYLRFSDPKQAAGSSADRQAAYAEKWAADHGLQLDASLSLRDEGLSAYHQAHVKKGALGTFLRAVEDGQIAPGSVLVVEGLDRLSRAEPIEAQAQLTQIITAGITVVTASDGHQYSRESLKANPMGLIYSLLVMIRANEESETKAVRVKAAIRRLCEQWQAGTFRGVIRNGKDPNWVEWSGTGWNLIPERVEAVHAVIDLFRQGLGSVAIVDRLNATGLLIGKDSNTASRIYKLVRLAALVGTKVLELDGVEYRLDGYYPAIMSRADFDEIQLLAMKRKRVKGIPEIPAMITGMGITACGYCGSAMTSQNMVNRKRDERGHVRDSHRRINCCADQAKRTCPVAGTTSIAPIERAILAYCSDQIRLTNLLDNTAVDKPIKDRIAGARTRIAELEQQTERLTSALLTDDGAVPAFLLSKARELESSLVKARHDLADAETELAAISRKTPAAADAWSALVEGVKVQDRDARIKARQLVADTFERIVIYRHGLRPAENDGRTLDLVLVPHGGHSRMLRVNRKTGELVMGNDVAPTAART